MYKNNIKIIFQRNLITKLKTTHKDQITFELTCVQNACRLDDLLLDELSTILEILLSRLHPTVALA